MPPILHYFRKSSHLLLLEIFFLLLLWTPLYLDFSTILDLSNALPQYLWISLSPFLAATIDTLDFKLYLFLYLACLWLFTSLVTVKMEKGTVTCHPLFTLLFLIFMLSLTWTFLVYPHFSSVPVFLAILVYLLFFKGCYSISLPTEKIIDFLIGIGLVIGFIALFQYFGVSFGFLEITDDYRRNVATTLGHNTSTSFVLYHTVLLILFFKRNKLQYFYPLLILLLFGIVVAQSRSTFIQIALNGCIVLLIFRDRLRYWWKKRSCKAGIILLLIIVLTQSFPNPLLLSRKSLVRRLYDFSPTVLMRGTRVRTNRIALDMMKDQPLTGFGINSFRYYYPYYQGEYFQSHEDTVLVPSDRRTDRLHNDVMQLVVETGIIIALFIVMLYIVLLYKLYRQKHYMFFFFLINFLLQALVDFPFRLPFLALYILFFVALAWKISFRPGFMIQPSRSILYTFVVCFALIFTLMLPFYNNAFYHSQAQRYVRLLKSPEGFLSPSQQDLMLTRARSNMEKALQYNFYDVDSHYYAGITSLKQGDVNEARYHFDLAKVEGSNHYLHYYLGQIYFQEGKLQRAREELRKSIFKSPNFTPSLYLQLRVLAFLDQEDPLFLRYYREYTGEEGYHRLMGFAFDLLEKREYRPLSSLFYLGTRLYPHDSSQKKMKYTALMVSERKGVTLPMELVSEIQNYETRLIKQDTLSKEEQVFLWFLQGEYEKIQALPDQDSYYYRFMQKSVP